MSLNSSTTRGNCGCPGLGTLDGVFFSFFSEFLALKVSLSVLGRTPESRRSIYVQYGCSLKPRGPEAQATYRHNMCQSYIQ